MVHVEVNTCGFRLQLCHLPGLGSGTTELTPVNLSVSSIKGIQPDITELLWGFNEMIPYKASDTEPGTQSAFQYMLLLLLNMCVHIQDVRERSNKP